MTKLKFVLFLSLFLGACVANPPKPEPGRVGSSFGGPVFRAPLNVVTGNSATITVFDSTVVPVFPLPERLVVSCRFDQNVTVLYEVQRLGSVTWRTVNGGGAGDVVTANQDTLFDYLVQGPNSRLQVVTGGTGPTTSEINIAPVYDRALAL